jgi:hypothetical protein
MGCNIFEYIKATANKTMENGYALSPLRMILFLYSKQARGLKTCLVIKGHVLNNKNMDFYASVTKSISQRLIFIITSANKFDMLTGDITNAYLYTDCDVQIYTRVGKEFEISGYSSLPKGSLAKVTKVLDSFPSSGRALYVHLQNAVRKTYVLSRSVLIPMCIYMRIRMTMGMNT